MELLQFKMGILANTESRRRVKHFTNEELQQLAEEFCFENSEVELLYCCFSDLLPHPKAFIELDDLAMTLHFGHPHFSQLPYLERLFLILTHRTPGRLFFQDYLTGISTFCLMNSEAILHFVFEWLDSDGDDRITKEDIILASKYIHPSSGEHTFFHNFLPELDRNIQQNHPFLDFDGFRELSKKLLYLIWPAYELQEKLREINLGGEFWRSQYEKIQKAELALKNSEKKAGRMLDKVKQLGNVKVAVIMPNCLNEKRHMRVGGMASTDMQLLQTHALIRRKSSPCIKAKFTTHEQQVQQAINQ